MTQQIIVILILLACGTYLAFQAYRYLRPKPGGKACGGGCCDGEEAKTPQSTTAKTIMISSDDLRARLKARKA
jgi:hypothetical protein